MKRGPHIAGLIAAAGVALTSIVAFITDDSSVAAAAFVTTLPASLISYVIRERDPRSDVVVSGFWLLSAWPAGPEEEPVLFFIRGPLVIGVTAAVVLLVGWSPWRKLDTVR